MPKPSEPANESSLPAISVRDCTVAFGDNVVLEDISFEVAQGSISAIIGPNGSGKTTAIKAILDLIPTSSGEIFVFGKHFHAVRAMVGYVPQKFNFNRQFPMTVREFLDLARHVHTPASRIAEKLKEVGLPTSVSSAELGTLSGGQLQRALIAQAILNDPQILILDEPSAGIDIAGERTLHDIIRHLNTVHGTTVLMVSHDISMISSLVDTVICVNRKLLCYGPPTSALTSRKIGEVFGPESRVFEHKSHRHDDRRDWKHKG
jgi:ABC-type Mn2+/Zn2+ transport system ATPase subunit